MQPMGYYVVRPMVYPKYETMANILPWYMPCSSIVARRGMFQDLR